MKRLNTALKGGKALIPFITAGHPKPELTVPIMHALVKHGADAIELGMPFSDPMADGPVIQQSSEQAIAQGVGLAETLAMVAEFRRQNSHTPVILMGYLNPIECEGQAHFVAKAAAVGVDAVLLVDCPPEEATDLQLALKRHDMAQIFLMAPTTTAARRQMIADHVRGFVYYVALKGVTGSADLDTEAIAADVAAIKGLVDVPVAVGFGVKDAASAQAVATHADAVVIGSALVSHLAACDSVKGVDDRVGEFLLPIRKSLNSML